MKRAARDGAAIAAALVVASAAVASCNFLVGVGDYTVGDAEADGSGGGPGDDASTPVDAGIDQGSQTRDGQADSPVDARNDRADVGSDARLLDAGPLDAGPDRAVGIDSGTVDTGVDVGLPEAEAGPPAVCGQAIPTSPAFTSIVNACVLASGCDPFDFPVTLSECITNDTLHAIPGLGCLSTITSCTGATNSHYSCEGDRYATSECATTSTSSCVGNVAIDCSASPGLPVDGLATNCTLTGGTCRTYTDSSGASRADCAVVPSCTVTDGSSQCTTSNTIYNCVSPTGSGTAGVGFGFSCTQIGATCATSGGSTSCFYNGTATCTSLGGASCVGDSLQVCTSLGQQFTYDCSKAGGTCGSDTAGNFACVSPGCPLTSTCTESCDGAHTLTVCVGGAPYAIDCTQYGANFTQCDTTSTFPRCIP